MIVGSGLENKTLEEVVKASHGKNPGLFNNAGQHYNHIHFWKWMKKGGGGKKLPGKLQAMVDKDLGGYDKMRTDFVQAGVTQFNIYLMNGEEEECLDAYGREIIGG